MKHTFLRLSGALVLVAIVWPAAAQQQVSAIPAGYVPEFGTMWTFDAPPLDYWQARYGFNATRSWLDHLRLASVRLPGCSASFVSEDGLVMTNHHCARSCIAAVSPPKPDYLHVGFTAATRADEPMCPNLYVDQLVGIEDVTGQVRGMVTATADAQRVAQREAAVASLQASCQETSGNLCQVVSFLRVYEGGAALPPRALPVVERRRRSRGRARLHGGQPGLHGQAPDVGPDGVPAGRGLSGPPGGFRPPSMVPPGVRSPTRNSSWPPSPPRRVTSGSADRRC